MNTTHQPIASKAEAIDAAKRGWSGAGLCLQHYEEREDCLVIDGYAKIDLRLPLEDVERNARVLAWQLSNTVGT